MLAFFKRRWLLLPCAVMLLACSVIDFGVGVFGALEGYLLLMSPSREFDSLSMHLPEFGKRPMIQQGPYSMMFALPIWVPLVPVLGWLVLSELRWRKKRAKE